MGRPPLACRSLRIKNATNTRYANPGVRLFCPLLQEELSFGGLKLLIRPHSSGEVCPIAPVPYCFRPPA
jgi:hypothetical protein